MIEHILIF